MLNMKWMGKLKGRGRILLVICAAVGAMLLLYPGSEKTAADTDSYKAISSYTEKLEGRIKKLCLAIDGIDNADVLVTLECGSEYVYADNVNTKSRGDGSYDLSSDYLIIDDGNGTSPVTVTEIYPRIRGVAVVCSGGDSVSVQKKLTELLSAALGIGANKIKISS